MKNYYKILEVSENASPEVIEKAYKVLVKKYHPDLQKANRKNDEKIKEINEAYQVLSDSFLKEQYDNELKEREKNKYNNNYKETDYSMLYKEKERLKYQLAHEKYEKEQMAKRKNNVEEENTTGNNMVQLLRSIFKYRKFSIKKLQKIDIIALILTIVVVIGIGVILYYLPFTHDWMNENFVDTPVTHWIQGIFKK